MKSLLLLLPLALFTQCAKAPAVTPTPQTFEERELAVVQAVAPLVTGQWKLTDVRYSKLAHFESPAGWPRDTVVAQLATLTLRPAGVGGASPQKHPAFEGELLYAGKTYPVSFALWANPAHVVRQQDPPAYFLLEYHFPNGTHQTEVEEQFLQDVGLIGCQFSLEAKAGQNTMQWQGLDRHLRTITLRK